MLLEEKGYTVLLAADGEEAVRMYSKNRDRISLVLTDLGLPKLGGLEALKRMMHIDPALKAVVASGYLEPMLRDQIVKTGAKRMVQKPYRPNEILRTVRDVIDNVHGEHSLHGEVVQNASNSDHPV
jgi:two-component system, cell cycle sensor histidine kinase and response regulator CckA